MMIKYAIALAVLIIAAGILAWAFLPARYLPRNRVRSMQVRLHLRLHPGASGLRHHRRPAPALEPAGRAAPVGPHPPIPPVAAARHRARRALGLPRPGALAARPAGAAGRARAGDGPAPHVQDRVPRRRHHGLPRPGHRHHHQGRRARPGPPRSARNWASVDVFNPQHVGGVAVHVLLVPGWSTAARTRPPRSGGRTQFAFAVSREGVEDGTFWSRQGE